MSVFHVTEKQFLNHNGKDSDISTLTSAISSAISSFGSAISSADLQSWPSFDTVTNSAISRPKLFLHTPSAFLIRTRHT